MTAPPPCPPGPPPGRVLVVVAHPDDAEYAAAGTLAQWASSGTRIDVCVVSSGRRDGDRHPREAEQRAASAVLGVADVCFLRRPDGFVEADVQLVRSIVGLVRAARPEVVLTHSPELNWSRAVHLHPDHLAVGTAAQRAVYPYAREAGLWPELGVPWTCPALWLTQPPAERVNTVIDIEPALDHKVAALAEHRSQLRSGPSARDRVLSNARLAATGAGAGQRLVEVFQVVDTAS